MRPAGILILLAIKVKMPSLGPELGLEPRTHGVSAPLLYPTELLWQCFNLAVDIFRALCETRTRHTCLEGRNVTTTPIGLKARYVFCFFLLYRLSYSEELPRRQDSNLQPGVYQTML